ncbi:MAG: type II secretion system F family protein [Planctomycetes bacterium]|nr:type II secretion system F family protein [Planctomycetota bacterium]
MTLWRYKAIRAAASGEVVSGELSGGSGAEVRAALRRVGLQVIDLKEIQGSGRTPDHPLARALERHLCRRRRPARAELFDGLATLLESGLPMLQSLDASLRTRRGTSTGRMLLSLREDLRDGSSLGAAMERQPAWFEEVEVAMVEAGQRGGTLPTVLRALADRHERAGSLAQKLAGALTYPALLTILGLGVVVFLSTRTLPDLIRVLEDAGVSPPALTLRVMAVGRAIQVGWPAALPAAVLLLAGWLLLRRRFFTPGSRAALLLDRLYPRVLRRARLAEVTSGLADLLCSGVPMVEALRVLAPAASHHGLAACLSQAASRIEHGAEVADALADERWFDAELLRLVEVGQASGELSPLLERLGRRLERSAARAIDRFAGLIEPGAILVLAALVGTVALAAILPLFQLQEAF